LRLRQKCRVSGCQNARAIARLADARSSKTGEGNRHRVADNDRWTSGRESVSCGHAFPKRSINREIVFSEPAWFVCAAAGARSARTFGKPIRFRRFIAFPSMSATRSMVARRKCTRDARRWPAVLPLIQTRSLRSRQQCTRGSGTTGREGRAQWASPPTGSSPNSGGMS
jgi:hypothetical protein